MAARRKTHGDASFCELGTKPAAHGRRTKNRTVMYRHTGGCAWTGVRDQPYKTAAGGWSGIMRRVLVGDHGESAGFHLRYFEIEPGGNSSLEHHRHEHVVVCIRGRGVVRTGRVRRTMDYLDTLYIAPDTPHQLLNPFQEPFGFFCIVNAKRDRPKILKD
ncbi:MAG: cupin domain-containing protein [Thermodesulfovibrionales bacterium]